MATLSFLSAHFFRHVQGADFYRQLHEQAVALVGPGSGRSWIDVGCGPGLVTRQAWARGYAVTGTDLDEWMLRLARLQSEGPSAPRYVQVDLAGLRGQCGQADVVSAASLLMVMPDRRLALAQLLETVAPGGTLLVVETGQTMSQPVRPSLIQGLARGKRAWVLQLWARMRQGRPFVNVAELCPPGWRAERHDLLEGLVHAWIVRQAQAPGISASAATG